MIYFYLKNKNTKAAIDVSAENLVFAQKKAADFLGGLPSDYVERFAENNGVSGMD